MKTKSTSGKAGTSSKTVEEGMKDATSGVKQKALEVTFAQIDKQYGKGAGYAFRAITEF